MLGFSGVYRGDNCTESMEKLFRKIRLSHSDSLHARSVRTVSSSHLHIRIVIFVLCRCSKSQPSIAVPYCARVRDSCHKRLRDVARRRFVKAGDDHETLCSCDSHDWRDSE